jgi:hypothetical protein
VASAFLASFSVGCRGVFHGCFTECAALVTSGSRAAHICAALFSLQTLGPRTRYRGKKRSDPGHMMRNQTDLYRASSSRAGPDAFCPWPNRGRLVSSAAVNCHRLLVTGGRALATPVRRPTCRSSRAASAPRLSFGSFSGSLTATAYLGVAIPAVGVSPADKGARHRSVRMADRVGRRSIARGKRRASFGRFETADQLDAVGEGGSTSSAGSVGWSRASPMPPWK